jgi:hypothetical protein
MAEVYVCRVAYKVSVNSKTQVKTATYLYETTSFAKAEALATAAIKKAFADDSTFSFEKVKSIKRKNISSLDVTTPEDGEVLYRATLTNLLQVTSEKEQYVSISFLFSAPAEDMSDSDLKEKVVARLTAVGGYVWVDTVTDTRKYLTDGSYSLEMGKKSRNNHRNFISAEQRLNEK